MSLRPYDSCRRIVPPRATNATAPGTSSFSTASRIRRKAGSSKSWCSAARGSEMAAKLKAESVTANHLEHGVFKNGSRRREEADFGAKNTSASLPRRLRLLRRFLNSPWPHRTQAQICLGQFGDKTLAFADGFAIAMRRRDSVPERGRDHRTAGPRSANASGGGDCGGRRLKRWNGRTRRARRGRCHPARTAARQG